MSLRFGRYEAVSKLGEGAMAAVHLARDPVLGRFVAVKVLHRSVAAGKTALQRFFNEAKTVARLPNPHVVEVFDFGKQGREYFLVMEFVDGRSLRALLEPPGTRSGPAAAEASHRFPPGRWLPEEVTASLLCQAAEGLETAARHGVVHRDIKPENLMVNSQGYLKIADFGIAHLQDDNLTRTGAVLGSPLYMSPEQVRGAKPITSQSDMFSLGAVFFRCLAGAPPFASSTLKGLFRKIAQDSPRSLLELRPGLDPALARLAETLLEKDPLRRGDGPRWLRAELRSWLFSRGVADPMERVAQYSRELLDQGLPADWKRSPDTSLPRTVVSSTPYDIGAAATEMASPATVREAGEPWDVGDPGEADEPWEASRRDAESPNQAETRGRSPATRAWMAIGAVGIVSAALLLVAAALMPDLLRPGSSATRIRELQATAGTGQVSTRGTAGESAGPIHQESPGLQPGVLGAGTIPGTARTAPVTTGAATGIAGTAPGGSETSPSGPAPLETPVLEGPHATETGTLVVQSAPPFALVFLDGNEVGVTPVRLANLTLGTHRLLVKSRAGTPLDTLLQVRPGRHVLRVRLDPRTVALEIVE